MSMRALRGLEMRCLCRDGSFELQYAGSGKYTDPKGDAVSDLMDMGCVACGCNYYTREKSAIEFCPACGFFERKKFKNFQELQAWSNSQGWEYLKITGHQPFGVLRGGDWRMVFAVDRMELEMAGAYEEIHALLVRA